MTDDWQIKFCDFGRARYNDKGDKLKTQTLDSGIENVAYTAPEVKKEKSIFQTYANHNHSLFFFQHSLQGLHGWCLFTKDGRV